MKTRSTSVRRQRRCGAATVVGQIAGGPVASARRARARPAQTGREPDSTDSRPGVVRVRSRRPPPLGGRGREHDLDPGARGRPPRATEKKVVNVGAELRRRALRADRPRRAPENRAARRWPAPGAGGSARDQTMSAYCRGACKGRPSPATHRSALPRGAPRRAGRRVGYSVQAATTPARGEGRSRAPIACNNPTTELLQPTRPSSRRRRNRHGRHRREAPAISSDSAASARARRFGSNPSKARLWSWCDRSTRYAARMTVSSIPQ